MHLAQHGGRIHTQLLPQGASYLLVGLQRLRRTARGHLGPHGQCCGALPERVRRAAAPAAGRARTQAPARPRGLPRPTPRRRGLARPPDLRPPGRGRVHRPGRRAPAPARGTRPRPGPRSAASGRGPARRADESPEPDQVGTGPRPGPVGSRRRPSAAGLDALPARTARSRRRSGRRSSPRPAGRRPTTGRPASRPGPRAPPRARGARGVRGAAGLLVRLTGRRPARRRLRAAPRGGGEPSGEMGPDMRSPPPLGPALRYSASLAPGKRDGYGRRRVPVDRTAVTAAFQRDRSAVVDRPDTDPDGGSLTGGPR